MKIEDEDEGELNLIPAECVSEQRTEFVRTAKRIGYTSMAVTCVVLLLSGCGKSAQLVDHGWAQPVTMSSSIEGFVGWVHLHRCWATLIGVGVRSDHSGQAFIFNAANSSWVELPAGGVPKGYVWGCASVDSQDGRILFTDGYAENEQLVMKALIGMVTDGAGLRNLSERSWITDKTTLLGKIGPNVKLSDMEGRQRIVGLGPGIVNGSEAYIPFSLDAVEVTRQGKSILVGEGPRANGVFYSADAGRTWQMEKISEQRAIGPAVLKTAGCVYYFAGIYPLWSSRKPAGAATWEDPTPLTKKLSFYGRYSATGEGDSAHVCWADRRHNKSRFSFDAPTPENCDIYYNRRKDADREWGKEVMLSKGVLYCYAPTISAEGNNVVVTWAGVRKAGKWHSDTSPNDIFYVTSKDGGQTWTKPQQVTDVAKDGITCGMPQVMLLNGVIQLLYTQGASQSSEQISPGLTKLGEGSWPIYHTQRPFPK